MDTAEHIRLECRIVTKTLVIAFTLDFYRFTFLKLRGRDGLKNDMYILKTDLTDARFRIPDSHWRNASDKQLIACSFSSQARTD